MVVAVKSICEFSRIGLIADPVKNVAVGDVFEECPEKQGSCEKQGNCQDGKAKMPITVPKHVCNQGEVHSPDNQWVRFSQHLKIIVLEKPCLPFRSEEHTSELQSLMRI